MANKKMSRQSQRHWHLVWIAFIPLITLSCSHTPKVRFTNALEALETCESFLHGIKLRDNVSTVELIQISRQWKALSDSAWNCIKNDSVNNRNYHAKTAFIIFCDSISLEMTRIIQSKERNFSDYYQMISQLGAVDLSNEQIQAHIGTYIKFFEGLDSCDTYHFTTKRTVYHYEQTLSNALRKGFKSKDDVLHFLEEEDRDFRAFLNHLPMMNNTPAKNIKVLTEQVTSMIYALAEGDSPVYDKAEVVVFMTMRTNRRLIQNAKTCVADIKKGRVKQAKIENAYLLMLLQPWMAIDDISFALASPAQRQDLARLADTMPSMLSALKTADVPLNAAELPATLIQRYLNNIIISQ